MAFRTQKISQMTPKGADLEATDLIEVSTIESGSYVTRSITGQELIDAIPLPPSGLTIGTTPIASGTIGRVLFEGTGNVLQESANLFWNNTNVRLGIGTSSPTNDLHISSSGLATIKIQSTGNASRLDFSGVAYNNIQSNNDVPFYFDFYNTLNFRGNGGSVQAMRIVSATGNVLINTTTDAGFKLDVNGTARVQGSATILNNGGRLTLQQSIAGSVFNGINFNDFSGFTDASIINNQNTGEFRFFTAASYFPTFYSNGAERMRIPTTGNVLINTTTDAGFKLDVNGTARVSATDGVTAFQITAPTRAWYFTTSAAGGTFNAISGAANGVNGTGNYGFVLSGGWSFNIGQSTSQPNSFFSVYPSGTNQGEVRIGGQTGNGSSLLTMESTTKGFLPPRMTTTQRNAIASPAAGLIVYDTTLNLPHFFNGTIWVSL